MSLCPSMNECPFFNGKMKENPNILNIYRDKYCKEDNSKFARWMISTTIGKEYATLDIYPNIIAKVK